MELYSVAKQIGNIQNELLFVAQVETETERIANELLRINRKVNVFERIIIPGAENQVRYINDLLQDVF